MLGTEREQRESVCRPAGKTVSGLHRPLPERLFGMEVR